MPPWKPEPGYGDLAGDRRLADAELALIARWIDGGMPDGDPGDLPRVPDTRQWQLGTPDLIVAMPEPYELSPDGGDVFRTFVVPIPISTAPICERRRVSSRPSPGRASRNHQDRPDPIVASPGRTRRRTRVRRRRRPHGDIPRWTLPRLDSGAVAVHACRGHGVAARIRERSRAGNAPDADRETGTRAGERRAVLHRSAAVTPPVHRAIGQPEHRHTRGRKGASGHGQLRSAGRRRSTRRAAARALSCEAGSRGTRGCPMGR